MGMPEFLKRLNQMKAPEVLEGAGRFTNFVRALELSGVADRLERKGPYTIFAPDDDAFNFNTLGNVGGTAGLEDLLYRFIVVGRYVTEDLRRMQSLTTVNGYPLFISSGDGIQVNGAVVIKPDVPYEKGIIHEVSTRASR
jgi:uncharacterized surface protein with fasciclin (FAS1) repeats